MNEIVNVTAKVNEHVQMSVRVSVGQAHVKMIFKCTDTYKKNIRNRFACGSVTWPVEMTLFIGTTAMAAKKP